MDWVRACKEDADDRTLSASVFSEAGPFNEMVVMGVLAVRLQGLNQELHWDGEKMRFTNIPADATIKTVIKDGFSIKDGHPTFKKTDRSGQRQPVRRGAYQAQLPRRLEAARHADVIFQNHFVRPSVIELARIAEARNGRKKFSHFVKPGAEPNLFGLCRGEKWSMKTNPI